MTGLCVIFILFSVRPKSLQSVQLFVILWTEAFQVSLSMGIIQARILELVAMPFSRESSRPRDQTCIPYVSCTGRQDLHH